MPLHGVRLPSIYYISLLIYLCRTFFSFFTVHYLIIFTFCLFLPIALHFALFNIISLISLCHIFIHPHQIKESWHFVTGRRKNPFICIFSFPNEHSQYHYEYEQMYFFFLYLFLYFIKFLFILLFVNWHVLLFFVIVVLYFECIGFRVSVFHENGKRFLIREAANEIVKIALMNLYDN